MRSSLFPVVVPAVALLLCGPSWVQGQTRFAAMAGPKKPADAQKSEPTSTVRLTSQIVEEDVAPEIVNEGEGAYASGTYGSNEGAPGLSPGCAYGADGSFGGYPYYGYNPDFGNLNGGMSVWPGVPACCDAWFGFCGEPRCYHCNCHQGRYLYYHCPCGACKPELLIWGKDCKGNCGSCGSGCKPVAMCYPSKTCGKSGATCRAVSLSGGNSVAGNSCCSGGEDAASPTIKPTPAPPVVPPHNDLPTSRPQSARRSSATR